MFDVTTVTSFNNLNEWLSEVSRYAGNNVHRTLIGNKCDLTEREVKSELATAFASEHNMPYLETSAKNSENIDELFRRLAQTLRDKSMKAERTVNLQSPRQESGGGSGCCG